MHPIQALIEDAGYETRSYSGRYMCGKECLGVVVDGPLGEFIGSILTQALENVDEDPEEWLPAAQAFKQMKTDDMGLGCILYFPRIPFENS